MKTKVPFYRILLAFFVFIGFLLAIRFFYSGKLQYLFLVWNIFLAWIPFAISTLFKKPFFTSTWKMAFVFCCWFVFFPNALYIITDLIHLQSETTIPKWFDALLLFSASVVGLIMAFASLFRAERMLQKTVVKKLVPVLIISILFLGSFGVYLGRFLRWNSWDIISNPSELLLTVGHRIIYPLDHLYTWGVTTIFTLFFYLLYVTIKKLPDYTSQAIE